MRPDWGGRWGIMVSYSVIIYTFVLIDKSTDDDEEGQGWEVVRLPLLRHRVAPIIAVYIPP
jgi:hypothetical protein